VTGLEVLEILSFRCVLLSTLEIFVSKISELFLCSLWNFGRNYQTITDRHLRKISAVQELLALVLQFCSFGVSGVHFSHENLIL